MPNIRDKRLALVVAMLLAFALVAVLIGGPPRSKKHGLTHQQQPVAATGFLFQSTRHQDQPLKSLSVKLRDLSGAGQKPSS